MASMIGIGILCFACVVQVGLGFLILFSAGKGKNDE